jgi:hypothetical protein
MERKIDFVTIRTDLIKTAEEKKLLEAITKLENKNVELVEFDSKVVLYKTVKE